jgi:hypothetical protein
MLNQNNQEGSFENDFSNIKFVTDNSKISLADLLSREKELAADYRIAIDGWGKTDLGAVVALDSCVRVHFTPGPDSNMEEIIQEYQFPANANLTIQSHPKYPHVEQLKTLCVEIPVSGEDRKKVVPMAHDQGANAEGNGNAQGTVPSGFGAVFGGDRTVGSSTWGAAFGYAKTTTLTHDGLSNLGMNSFSGSVYTQQELGDFTINGLAAYTYHKIDGSRTISNVNATALSDYHAHQATIQGEIARKFTYDHNKDITPYVLGRYMNIATSAYTETGAGAANLVSNGENYWSLDLVLGARMDVELDKDTKLTFGGGYSHRFGDNFPEATFAFSGGGNFTTTGVERNRHSAFFEVGFEKSFSEIAKFFASANASLTDTHQSIGGNVGFKVRF